MTKTIATTTTNALATLTLILAATAAYADPESAPRARDLGMPFAGEPGPLNAITDVAGLTVGHVTLIADAEDGAAVRTGVTAVLPRGHASLTEPAFAGWFG